MTELDLIVLDMDGVLTDSSPIHARAYEELWARLGIEGPAYPTIAGWTTVATIRTHTAALHPSQAQLAEWVAFKQARARAFIEAGEFLFPDVKPALAWMAERGFRLAVGTGASRATATLLLRQSGILDYFRVLVTADDVRRGKPAPDTFADAIAGAGGTPARSLVIEDSASGLVAGDAAGAWTAAVRTGEALTTPRFIGTFPDLRALTQHLATVTA